MEPLPLWLAIAGLVLLVGGACILTGLFVAHRTARPLRRRAEAAEEALARHEAQGRQYRQPHPAPPAQFRPGQVRPGAVTMEHAAAAWDRGDPAWVDLADEAIHAEAPTVLMGALTPTAVRDHSRLYRGGGR